MFLNIIDICPQLQQQKRTAFLKLCLKRDTRQEGALFKFIWSCKIRIIVMILSARGANLLIAGFDVLLWKQ